MIPLYSTGQGDRGIVNHEEGAKGYGGVDQSEQTTARPSAVLMSVVDAAVSDEAALRATGAGLAWSRILPRPNLADLPGHGQLPGGTRGMAREPAVCRFWHVGGGLCPQPGRRRPASRMKTMNVNCATDFISRGERGRKMTLRVGSAPARRPRAGDSCRTLAKLPRRATG